MKALRIIALLCALFVAAASAFGQTVPFAPIPSPEIKLHSLRGSDEMPSWMRWDLERRLDYTWHKKPVIKVDLRPFYIPATLYGRRQVLSEPFGKDTRIFIEKKDFGFRYKPDNIFQRLSDGSVLQPFKTFLQDRLDF
jgi:hypothetical protein